MAGRTLIDSSDNTGAYATFDSFKKFELTQQMRAADDNDHCEVIQEFQNFSRTITQHQQFPKKCALLYQVNIIKEFIQKTKANYITDNYV